MTRPSMQSRRQKIASHVLCRDCLSYLFLHAQATGTRNRKVTRRKLRRNELCGGDVLLLSKLDIIEIVNLFISGTFARVCTCNFVYRQKKSHQIPVKDIQARIRPIRLQLNT